MVNAFCHGLLNPYVNYHRPCFFAETITDEKGKTRKKYRLKDMMTPYEKLKSLAQPCALPTSFRKVNVLTMDGQGAIGTPGITILSTLTSPCVSLVYSNVAVIVGVLEGSLRECYAFPRRQPPRTAATAHCACSAPHAWVFANKRMRQCSRTTYGIDIWLAASRCCLRP